MTEPRRFVPHATYMVTRRCTQRKFWLKPTPQTNEIFLYCLAVAAKKTGVLIHAVIVMSNHYHVVFTDPDMRAAEFYGWMNKYVAKALNASYGRWENLWSSEKASVVQIEKPKDVLDKVVYTLCNPVQAQLVAKGDKWPGIRLFKPSHSREVTRPEVYFREDGPMPKEIELKITIPPQYKHLSEQEYVRMVEERVSHKEQKIADKMEKKGQSFLGVDGVRRQKTSSSPNTQEPRRGLNPRIAAKSKWQRIEAIKRNKEFLADYRDALKRWSSGDRDVEFPFGTYQLRVQFGVRCAPG